MIICACANNPGPAREQSQSLPPIIPDYCDVVMPCNMALPSFMVEGATHIRAEISPTPTLPTGGGSDSFTPVVVLEGENEICLEDIRTRLNAPLPIGEGLGVRLSVWSSEHPDGIRYAPFTITLSPDTIDRWLTYRLIPPGYEGWHTMGIYQRDLTTYDETPIVTINRPEEGCVNCHTPSWGNPNRRLYHKRGEGGGTLFYIDGREYFINLKDAPAISKTQKLTSSKTQKLENSKTQKLENSKTQPALQGSYPAWHPSGRYIAFASTDTHQSFFHHSRDKIEVYDLGGRLFVYDTQSHTEILYDQFSDSTLWHTFPTFSPDGCTLYYCRARAVNMPHEVDSLHYDLVSVSFDPETAELGEPTTVISSTKSIEDSPSPIGEGRGGASSISFPRVSPDGRFLMYTVADCGTFPIWHKEADLAMIDLTTGLPVDISAINSDDVDSFHNWSTNSRWVVFSSRRVDGRYTRLFFAHIDEQGHVSKPFLLPQSSPLHDLMLMDSYNIPELIIDN